MPDHPESPGLPSSPPLHENRGWSFTFMSVSMTATSMMIGSASRIEEVVQ